MCSLLHAFVLLAALQIHFAVASILDSAKFIFTFGDSYTATGWKGTGDPLLSQTHRSCSSAGPNWSLRLNTLVNHTQLISLAVGGATSDSSIVFTAPPDFRSQVASFTAYVTRDKVAWTASNAIFAVSFGTNDISKSYKNTTGSGTDLYNKDLTSYFATVNKLYNAGARRFLFNNVVPLDRSQTGIKAGTKNQAKLKACDSVNEFNSQLASKAKTYCASKTGVTCAVYDTHSIFTKMLDNPAFYGFISANATCSTYASYGGCTIPSTSSTCSPPSAYIWRDDLHPAYGAHARWARGVFDQLSTVG